MASTYVFCSTSIHMDPATHQHLLALDLTLTPLNRSANVYTNRSARVSVTSLSACLLLWQEPIVIMGRVVLIINYEGSAQIRHN